MKFRKMQGLGNDFVIINHDGTERDYSQLARQMCDRHFGIGADGLMVVWPSEVADCRMRIFNADGTEPEMCGNGLRCFARFVYETGIVSKAKMTVETLAGILTPEMILDANGQVQQVQVDMGQPVLAAAQVPMVSDQAQVIGQSITAGGVDFTVTAVSMGNPHCVVFVDEMAQVPLPTWGPLLERSAYFPQKTNVEFAQVLNEREIIMRVWERGAGVTLACGTGACATAVAAVLNGKTARQVTVHLDGGDLFITWDEKTNHIMMTGSAENVFDGLWLR